MGATPDATAARDYEFSDRHFGRVCQLVRARLGISLSDSRRELVYGRLSRRLRSLRVTDFDSYLRLVESSEHELQQFCNALTTNLTSFFREHHHFDYLAERLLPALERNNRGSRRVRIWSAGCSSGEEAYSIAIVLRETLGLLHGWDVRILATDVDSNVLAYARRGRYSGERLERVQAGRILRWFERCRDGGHYQISDELRGLVRFNPLNLIDDWPMRGPFDAIFCRNVVIYFDRDTQRAIVRRMAALQRPGDHLILGHSESLLNASTQYRLVGHTVYRRVG